MGIVSATTVKTYFETGDKPSQSEFVDFIDSAMRLPLMAIASAVEGGQTGIILMDGTASATTLAAGGFGLQVLSCASTASGQNTFGIGTFGANFIAANTTAAAASLLNLGASSTAASTLDNLTDVSAPSPASGAALIWSGANWQPSTAINSSWVATQAQMEGASASTVLVAPNVAQYHPGMAKAWVRYNASTASILASYNVASVTKNAAGDFTVTFSTPFSSSDYAYAGMGQQVATNISIIQAVTAGAAAGSLRFTIKNQGASNQTPQTFALIFYGDQ